jgi:spore maturation protein SpmB
VKARHFFSRRELSALVSVLVLVATGCSDAIFSPKNQTISFAQIPSQTLGVAPLSLTATASSSLPVSFASTTQTVCTVSSNTTSGFSVALIATGTCSIVATQAGGSAPVAGTNGNVTYEAAAPVSQSFTVNGEGQTITFTDGHGEFGAGGQFCFDFQQCLHNFRHDGNICCGWHLHD